MKHGELGSTVVKVIKGLWDIEEKDIKCFNCGKIGHLPKRVST